MLTLQIGFEWGWQVGLMLAAALGSAIVAILVWRDRDRLAATELAALAAAISVLCLAIGLGIGSTDRAVRLFWLWRVATIFLSLATLAIFVFAVTYTGRARWARRRRLAVLGFPLFVTAVLVVVAPAHPVLVESFGDATLSTSCVCSIVAEPGPIAGLWNAYWTVMMAGSLILLIYGAVMTRRFARRQASAVVVGALIPLVAPNLMDAFALGMPFEWMLVFMVALFAYAIRDHQLVNIASIAHERALDSMHDGMFVVDASGRIVDCNEPASVALGASDGVIGSSFADVADEQLVSVVRSGEDGGARLEFSGVDDDTGTAESRWVGSMERDRSSAG